MKAQTAADVPGANSTVGRISAARQQTISAALSASAVASRLRFIKRASEEAGSMLPRAMLFIAEFTGRFLDIRI